MCNKYGHKNVCVASSSTLEQLVLPKHAKQFVSNSHAGLYGK